MVGLFSLKDDLVAAAAALLAAALLLFIHQLLETIEIDSPAALLSHNLREIQGKSARIVQQKCKLFGHDGTSPEGGGLAAELFDSFLQCAQKGKLLIEDNTLRPANQ